MKGMRLAGLAALLFLFPWLAIALAANLALVPAEAVGSSGSVGGDTGNVGTSLITQPSTVTGPSSLELVVLAAVAASAVTVYAWRLNKRRRKDDYFWYREQPKGSPLLALALLGITLTSFYGLYLLAENSPTLLLGGQAESFPPILPYLTLSAVAGGFAVAVLVSASMLKSGRTRTESDPEAGQVDRTELSKILRRTADSLDLGSDYRGAILRCYAAICQILDRNGSEDSSRLTAREFESKVASRLNVGGSYLHEATMLFEKARYSTIALHEGDVRQAQFCLRELSNRVLSSGLPEAGV